MSSFTSSLSEAELHGLVDGQIEQGRRIELLRRAASSPADRSRIEAWQEQAQALQTAFRDVDRDPLPASLNLHTPVRLHAEMDAANSNQVRPRWAFRPGFNAVGFSVAFAIVSALAATALFQDKNSTGSWASLRDGLPWRNSGNSDVHATAVPVTTVAASGSAVAMPASNIPDLTFAGFTFRAADTRFDPLPTLTLRYQDDRGERLAISVTRATPRSGSSARAGGTLAWHKGAADYVIDGNVDAERLKAISAALRDELQDE